MPPPPLPKEAPFAVKANLDLFPFLVESSLDEEFDQGFLGHDPAGNLDSQPALPADQDEIRSPGSRHFRDESPADIMKAYHEVVDIRHLPIRKIQVEFVILADPYSDSFFFSHFIALLTKNIVKKAS